MAPRPFTWYNRHLVVPFILTILWLLSPLFQGAITATATMNPCAAGRQLSYPGGSCEPEPEPGMDACEDILRNAPQAIQGAGVSTDGRLFLMVHDQMFAIPLDDAHLAQKPEYNRIALFPRGPGFMNYGNWYHISWLSRLPSLYWGFFEEDNESPTTVRFNIFPNAHSELGNVMHFTFANGTAMQNVNLYNYSSTKMLSESEFDQGVHYYPYSMICGVEDNHKCYQLRWDKIDSGRVVIEPEPFYKGQDEGKHCEFKLKMPNNGPESKVPVDFYYPEWNTTRVNYLNLNRRSPSSGTIQPRPHLPGAFVSPRMPGFIHRGKIHLWDLKLDLVYIFDDTDLTGKGDITTKVTVVPFEYYFACSEQNWTRPQPPFNTPVALLVEDLFSRARSNTILGSWKWLWIVLGLVVIVLVGASILLTVARRRSKTKSRFASRSKRSNKMLQGSKTTKSSSRTTATRSKV